MTSAKAAVVALLVCAGSLVAAPPAAAHSGYYCGHGTSSHWGWVLWVPWRHTVTFQRSWTDRWPGGKHQHEVTVNDGYFIRLSSYPC